MTFTRPATRSLGASNVVHALGWSTRLLYLLLLLSPWLLSLCMILYPILEHRRSAHFYRHHKSAKNATGLSTPIYDGVDPLNRFLMMLLAVPSGQSLHLYICHPIRRTLFTELMRTQADKPDRPVHDGRELPGWLGPLAQAILGGLCACTRWAGTFVGILVRYLIKGVFEARKRYAQSCQKDPAPPSIPSASMLQEPTEPQGKVQYKRVNILGRDHFVPIENDAPRAPAPDNVPEIPTAQSTIWPWSPRRGTSRVSPPSLASPTTSPVSKLRLSSSARPRRPDPVCFPTTAHWNKQKSYRVPQRPRSDFDDSAWIGYRDDQYRATSPTSKEELDVAAHLEEVEGLQSFVHKLFAGSNRPFGASSSGRECTATVTAKPNVSAKPNEPLEPADDPLASLKALLAQGSLWSKPTDNKKAGRTADAEQGIKERSYETKGTFAAARDAAPIRWQPPSSASAMTSHQPAPFSLAPHGLPASITAFPTHMPAYQIPLPSLAPASIDHVAENHALASVMEALGLPVPQVGAPHAYKPQAEERVEYEQSGQARESFYMSTPQQQPAYAPLIQQQPAYKPFMQEQPIYMQPNQPLYTQQTSQPEIHSLPAFADWEPTPPVTDTCMDSMPPPILPTNARVMAESNVTPQRLPPRPTSPTPRYPNGVERTRDPRIRRPAAPARPPADADEAPSSAQYKKERLMARKKEYEDSLNPATRAETLLELSAQTAGPSTLTATQIRAAQIRGYNDRTDRELSFAEALRSSA